jgi:hypothetical protein
MRLITFFRFSKRWKQCTEDGGVILSICNYCLMQNIRKSTTHGMRFAKPGAERKNHDKGGDKYKIGSPVLH